MDCIMSVCGDDMYFRMAEYSIPSFIENNIGSTLHVVTDKPWKFATVAHGARIYDWSVVLGTIQPLRISGEFDNNGKTHKHDTVSNLPIIGQALIDSRWICKIDCDSYFHGNLFKEIDMWIANCKEDLILADRSRTDIMKPYGVDLPGAGLLIWRKDGNFVKEYVNQFDGNEQSTVLNLYMNKSINCNLIMWPGAHWVYPFTWYEQNGAKFTKEVADMFIPFYIHVGGSNQLEQLETLRKWYGV